MGLCHPSTKRGGEAQRNKLVLLGEVLCTYQVSVFLNSNPGRRCSYPHIIVQEIRKASSGTNRQDLITNIRPLYLGHSRNNFKLDGDI